MSQGNLVVLAAGIASRMRKPSQGSLDPVTARDADEKTKSMIGLGKKHRPFLDYLLHNAHRAGYVDVVIVVGEQDRSIRGYYGEKDRANQYHGLSISYAVQRIPEGRRKPLGTADALLQGLLARPDWEGQKVTVCNSDNLYSERALCLIRESHSPCALIDFDRDALEFEQERIEQFAILITRPDGKLLGITEKPSPTTVERARDASGRIGVSMNLFRFSYDLILPFLKEVPPHPVRHEKELPSAVMLMLREHPDAMETIRLSEHVPDLTYRSDIERVRQFLDREFPRGPFDTL
jgi:NDP-sugar pyrophosphorylase family protein